MYYAPIPKQQDNHVLQYRLQRYLAAVRRRKLKGGGRMGIEKRYRVTIEDELMAETPWNALRATLERLRGEETLASVECLSTGEIFRYEVQAEEGLYSD